ncbi:Gag-Pol polyprotein, partial [Harpegnathos saltator]
IRLRGLEISTSEEEAAEQIAQVGGCGVAEVQTGLMRTMPSGSRSLWMRCPLAAARKVAERGTLSIGWTQVKVEWLDVRPLQCYKCLERGHVQQTCDSKADRRQNCYRCGETGHLARNCTASARCVICAEAGKPAG